MTPSHPGIHACGRPAPAVFGRTLVFTLTVAALLFSIFGFASCLAGLWKNAGEFPFAGNILACGAVVIISIGGCFLCLKQAHRISDRRFLLGIVVIWLISRSWVVAAFPNYRLQGDEVSLHKFVAALVNQGLTPGNLAALSSEYDYPVWLSRAFPVYYPVRLIFGARDLRVLQLLNVGMSCATVVFIFLIARRLAGRVCAMCSAWILTAFPHFGVAVLNYDPQIPGTLFLVAGIWLSLLELNARAARPLVRRILRGAAIGGLAFLAGMQRGGVDLVLICSFAVLVLWDVLQRADSAQRRARLATLLVAVAIWLPARTALDRWVEIHDTHHLRAHVLGFVTRGSNPVTMGEYLARYEQLDMALPPRAKPRVLLAVLDTEAVRQPLRTFGILPPAKMGKFFLFGYGGGTEGGMVASGYRKAADTATLLKAYYAVLMAALVLAGCFAALRNRDLQWQLRLVTLTLVGTAGAVVLFWEASPHYSDCIQYAIATIAGVGFVALVERSAVPPPASLARASLAGGILALLWVGIAGAAWAIARSHTAFQFADLSQARSYLRGQPVESIPLDRHTSSWERELTLPPGTTLPVEVELQVPLSGATVVAMSFWAPDGVPPEWRPARLVIASAPGAQDVSTLQESAVMKRAVFGGLASRNGYSALAIRLLPPEGERTFQSSSALALAFGYVLPGAD